MCRYFCTGEGTHKTYSESVFVALVIQHEMRLCHAVICGLPGSKTFFCIISHKALLNICVYIYIYVYVCVCVCVYIYIYTEHKICFLIFCTSFFFF